MLIDLALAGLRLRLDLGRDDMRPRIAERYAAFSGEPDGSASHDTFQLAVEIDPQRCPPGLHPTHVDNPRVHAHGSMQQAAIVGDGFEAEFDWSRGTGRAVIPDSLAHLDLCVRVALGVGLLRTGGTFLHAAGALRDRWGMVFSGPSGAGKSTIAGICRAQGLTTLADEMIVVRRTGAGTRIFGTPFWHGTPGGGPAGAIFLLRQAPTASVTRITADAALVALMKAGGAPLALPDVQEAFFAACAETLRRVPAYRLDFAPDASFLGAIDRLPEFAFWRPRLAAGRAPSPTPRPIAFGGLRRPAGAGDPR